MRRVLFTVLLAIVAALGLLASSFTAATLELTTLEIDRLPAASPPKGMSISALPTGEIRSRAALAFRGGRFAEEREFTMTAILVRHPRGDLLFDTGLGRDLDAHVQMLPAPMRAVMTFRRGTPAAVQLEANGLAPSSLAGVVLSHAHWDHVSGLDALPGVPVWLSPAEAEFIAANTLDAALFRHIAPANRATYEFDDGSYLGFPRSHDVWGDGSIVLVPAPGHTPGSIIAFVTLPSGTRYALLGDVVWQLDGVELPAERPWIVRRLVDGNAAALRRLIALVATLHRRFPEIRMVPAHDVRPSLGIPVFPGAAG